MIGGALYARVTLQGLARLCISLTSHLATFCTFADGGNVVFVSVVAKRTGRNHSHPLNRKRDSDIALAEAPSHSVTSGLP